MAIDPAKSKAVSQVVREHPGMSLVAISPGIVVFLLVGIFANWFLAICLLYTSPSPRDRTRSRMPSSA